MQEITFTSNQIMISVLSILGLFFTCAAAGYLIGLKVGKDITFAEIGGYCHRPKEFHKWEDALEIKRHMYGPKLKAIECRFLDNNICSILEKTKAKNCKCEFL